MGQGHHGSAATTAAIRRAIQHSQESQRALAKRYGINQKTVAKWRKRTSVADRPTGPTEPKSTSLSMDEEAVVVAFRRHTLLPLDDCLYALQPTIPHLTRSSLHRCLQRHGISRLPDVDGNTPAKKRFKAYPIGYVHIDIAEVQTAEGKLYLYVAIDCTCKFAVVRVVRKTGRSSASDFLEHVIDVVPYRIHAVLTDNGIQFTFPPRYANGPNARYMTHMFDMRCREHGIEHRLTKVKHPWTNGQVERMNRTIKEATVKRFHYDDHRQFKAHLADFVAAYNFGRRLKMLRGLTPYEFICKTWTSEPERCSLNPIHQMPGLNNPSDHETVHADVKGFRRRPNVAVKQKTAATAEVLTAMLSHAPAGLAGKRDRALLALGFAGAFRRSELAALDVADLVEDRDGLRVRVRRSKMDQEGQGIAKAVPHGQFIRPVELVQE